MANFSLSKSSQKIRRIFAKPIVVVDVNFRAKIRPFGEISERTSGQHNTRMYAIESNIAILFHSFSRGFS